MSDLENTVNILKEIKTVDKKTGMSFRGLYGIELASGADLEALVRLGESPVFEALRKIYSYSEANSMRKAWQIFSKNKEVGETFTSVDWLEGFGVVLGIPYAAMVEIAKRKKVKEQLVKKKK